MSGGGGQRGTRPVAALVPDLMDRSRIEATGRVAGVSVLFLHDTAELRALGADAAGLVIIDLDAPGALSALSELGAVRTLGFASHVERDLLAAASAAGCGEVVSRAVLFRRLPALLASAPIEP